jgi:hypothetical protein
MRQRRETGQQTEKNKHQHIASGETGLPDSIINQYQFNQ